jgi:hypothetical protein
MSKFPAPVSPRSISASWKILSLSAWLAKYPTPVRSGLNQFTPKADRPSMVPMPYEVIADSSLRVSTSAKNGAMTGVPVAPVSANGVNVDRLEPKVTLPLLLTKSWLKVDPPKFTPKPMLAAGDEPSSFRGSEFVKNPVVPAPVRTACACASGGAATDTTAMVPTIHRSDCSLMSPPLSSCQVE